MAAMTSTRDIQLGEQGFLRKVVRRRKLESVFLFATVNCNSKCRTCFYAKETHPGADLTFAEIQRLSETAPPFDKLWLSGGEPLLRDDLVEIVALFYRNNGIRTVNFPTNGLLADRVESEVRRLADTCPKLAIHLNFSLDGLGEVHDKIRGVPGSFERTMAAMERTKKAFAGHPRIHQNVASVVVAENIDGLHDLGLYLFKRFNLATQFFEAVRGESRDPQLARVDRRQLEGLHQRLLPLYDAMAERLFGGLPRAVRGLAKMSFIGMTLELYRLQRANLEGPHPWGMDCTAGETTLVVDHDGGFRACELRPRIGHLRDYGFDLAAAHGSPAMRDEIRAIGGGARANCWCTHTCWTLSSTKFSPRKIVLDVPRGYLAAAWKGYPKLDPARIDLADLERRYHLARA
ncbi:MAG TPA: radical SAM protein [Myxococcota bacterium]|nr:radical SAM protein [Myxococcota bacterium]HRY94558.1 radical SAM protein [Myxococcota bacterium]